jgi:hypothetical protein
VRSDSWQILLCSGLNKQYTRVEGLRTGRYTYYLTGCPYYKRLSPGTVHIVYTLIAVRSEGVIAVSRDGLATVIVPSLCISYSVSFVPAGCVIDQRALGFPQPI